MNIESIMDNLFLILLLIGLIVGYLTLDTFFLGLIVLHLKDIKNLIKESE